MAKTSQLIALEGTSGAALASTAKHLARSLQRPKVDGGISRWDASGIFTELAAGDPTLAPPSPRTLLLLYAADLAFRLRWQIKPALAGGGWVIAAPYVESAVAFGVATGLPRRWMAELFRFAPKPDVGYRVANRSARTRRPHDKTGYFEFFCGELRRSPRGWDVSELTQKSATYLEKLDYRVPTQAVRELKRSATRRK